MIQVTILKDSENEYRGVRLSGHAGYAEEGFDIICSAVSALAINTVNSIEEFTEDMFSCETENEGGYLSFQLTGDVSAESRLLVKSLVLGITNIRESYGAEYINIRYKEV